MMKNCIPHLCPTVSLEMCLFYFQVSFQDLMQNTWYLVNILITRIWLYACFLLEREKKIYVNLYSGCSLNDTFSVSCVCCREVEFRSLKELKQE